MTLPGQKDVVDKWLLVGEPRHGGTAVVWKAVDSSDPTVLAAIKIVRADAVGQRLADEIFEREYQALERLRHPHIVELIDAGVDREHGFRYFVFPWLEDSLEGYLEAQRPEGWDAFYENYGRPILDALAYAHSKQTVHRDIKPGNIMFDADGVVKVADFGIARAVDSVQIGLTVRDWKSKPYAPRDPVGYGFELTSDVHAFAALCVLALEPKLEITEPYERLDAALEDVDVPDEVEAILTRALQESDKHRHPTCEVLRTELETIQDNRRRALKPAAGKRMKIQLVLAPKTRDALLNHTGFSSEEQVQDALFTDLQQAFAFNYMSNSDPDRPQVFRLIGTEYELVVSVHPQWKDSLLVERAFSKPSSTLERKREEGFTPNVEFTFKTTPRTSAAALRLRELLDSLEDQYAESQMLRAQDADKRPLVVWRRTLQLLRSYYRTREEPLRYFGFSPGERTVFDLVDRLPEDIIGQTRTVDLAPRGTLSGVVASTTGSQLTLAVSDGNPNDLPREGVLRLDQRATTTALRRQELALESVETKASLRMDLVDLLLDPDTARKPITCDAPESWFRTELDEGKRAAVSTALGTQDILVVEGPPGTGKTTFITELIRQEIDRDHEIRILIASQTHVALDNVLERLASDAPDLKLLRIAADDGRIAKSVEPYRMKTQLGNWKELAEHSSSEWLRRWASERDLDSDQIQTALAVEELAASARASQRSVDAVVELDAEIERLRLAQAASRDKSEAQALTKARAERQAANDELARIQRSSRKLFSALQAAGNLPSEVEWNELDPEALESAANTIASNSGKADYVKQGRELIRLAGEWHARFGVGEDFKTAALVRSQVVAATCVGLGAIQGLDSIEFDLCIIDEASKANATELLVPMARSKRWILVGDSKQLPPFIDEVLRDPDQLEERGLTKDEIEESLFKRLVDGLPETSRNELLHQHRMLPAIGNLISSCFYGGKLTSEPRRIPNWVGRLSESGRAVVWLSTSHLDRRREQGAGDSFINTCESEIVSDLIARVNAVAGKSRTALDVAVLTAYSPQREAMQRSINSISQELKNVRVECGTVDSFQGREADVAIYSVTRSNPYDTIGFLREPSRINVALSRARSALFIVGDDEFCSSTSGENPFVEVLDHINSHPEECAVEMVGP